MLQYIGFSSGAFLSHCIVSAQQVPNDKADSDHRQTNTQDSITMFYVGHLRPFRWSEVKHVSSHDDMRDAAYGDIFEVLGHIFEWDDDCVPSDLCTR